MNEPVVGVVEAAVMVVMVELEQPNEARGESGTPKNGDKQYTE